MSAETLRRAAALMRDRAGIAPAGPWHVGETNHLVVSDTAHTRIVVRQAAVRTSHHIASWDPDTALAVADWLDAQATLIHKLGGFFDVEDGCDAAALNLARTYLGENP